MLDKLFHKILDNIFYILLLFIAFIIFKNLIFMQKERMSDKLFKYFIKSNNDEFIWQTRQILNNSSVNQTHNIQEVLNENNSDITIELKPREELSRLYRDPTYYPGTKKEIFYSFTVYSSRPIKIFIDEINWIHGVTESGLTIPEYRKYVIQHEFMHALGYDHQPCNTTTATNGRCPIMYQSTIGCPEGFKCGYNISAADYTKRLY